jgi:DNA polymerase III epsilon subunit-like protein
VGNRKVKMITYIGLDGEMSSADIKTGGKLIQIGMAKYCDGEMISIGSLLNPGSMDWSEEAAAVHQFTKKEIEENGEDPAMIDQSLANWANPTKERRDCIMVGFNVGSFDRPFVEQSLPILFSKFSRRTVDLNSIIFAMSDSDKEFNQIKKMAKEYAIKQMTGMFDGFKDRQHDAEYDAVMALYCFEYLRAKIFNPEDLNN